MLSGLFGSLWWWPAHNKSAHVNGWRPKCDRILCLYVITISYIHYSPFIPYLYYGYSIVLPSIVFLLLLFLQLTHCTLPSRPLLIITYFGFIALLVDIFLHLSIYLFVYLIMYLSIDYLHIYFLIFIYLPLKVLSEAISGRQIIKKLIPARKKQLTSMSLQCL